MLPTFVTVMQSGGIYTPEWVRKLSVGIARHAPAHHFMVLTDQPEECGEFAQAVPVFATDRGWWTKLQLFSPAMQAAIGKGRPVVYLDLDTLLVGDLSDLCAVPTVQPALTLLSDLFQPRELASGVMTWEAGHASVESAYQHARASRHRGTRRRMDFTLREVVPMDQPRLQDHVPGQIWSLKRGCDDGPPPDARVICAHGPKKWVKAWAASEWEAL